MAVDLVFVRGVLLSLVVVVVVDVGKVVAAAAARCYIQMGSALQKFLVVVLRALAEQAVQHSMRVKSGGMVLRLRCAWAVVHDESDEGQPRRNK